MRRALLTLLLAGLPALALAQGPQAGVPEIVAADPLQIVGPPAGPPLAGGRSSAAPRRPRACCAARSARACRWATRRPRWRSR